MLLARSRLSGIQRNGKNKITWSLRAPTSEDPGIIGDTWWVNEARTREDGTVYLAIIAQYQYQSGGWVQVEMAHEVIASVDLGTATVGELDGIRIMANTIGTEQLRADFADFMVSRNGTVIAGDGRSILDNVGLRVFNDAGDVRTQISPDHTTVKGEIEAETLVVNGGAEFRSTQNVLAQGAKLTLAAGVTDPTAPPLVQSFWETAEFEPPTWVNSRMRGLAWDGAHYWTGNPATNAFGGDSAARIDGTTGDVTQYKLDADVGIIYGVTFVGTELFWLYRNGYDAFVLATDLNCVKIREWQIENLGHSPSSPLVYKPGIGTDGTDIYVAHCQDDGTLTWKVYDKTTGARKDLVITSYTTSSDLTGVYVGNGDWGSNTVTIAKKSANNFITLTPSGDNILERQWDAAEDGETGVAFHDGKFYSLNPQGYIHEYTDMGDNSGDWWAAYRWTSDTTPEDPYITNWSRISPPKRFTWPRRAKIKVMGQPLPEGVDFIGPSLAKKTTTPVRTDFHSPDWKIRSGESVAWWDVLPADWETAAVPSDSNNFPDAETAVIESASATFHLEGDGSGWWGPLEFPGDGTVGGILKNAAGRTILETTTTNETVAAFVTFPAGRFTERPSVTATADSVVPGTGLIEVSAAGPTKDGFTLYMRRATAARTGITWIAMEMG